ncbi:MAG: hypothetical protein ACTSV7_10870 [Candidatus Baldrarchaeia archaeon]
MALRLLSCLAIYCSLPPSVIFHTFLLPLTILTLPYIVYGMAGKLPSVKTRNYASTVATGIILFTLILVTLPYVSVFPTWLLAFIITLLFSIAVIPKIIYDMKEQKVPENFQSLAFSASSHSAFLAQLYSS